MTITPHELPSGKMTDPTSYQGQLYLELCQMECVGGIPNQTIYDDGVDNSDSGKAHNPTIGVGFNLRATASLLAVMQAYFGYPDFDVQGKSDTYQQDNDLMSNLKTIMGESWDGNGNVAARTQEVVNAINAYFTAITPEGLTAPSIATFQLDDTQIQTAFTTLSIKFETEVTDYFNISHSDERIALMSLAWNSPTPPLQKGSLLGPGLHRALESGNRADAWFQIRYNSNGGSSENDGIAKRRYFESQLFGLYNEAPGAAIPEDEALQVYGMLSEVSKGITNRSKIFTYENEYSKEIDAANKDYHSVLGVTVQTLEDALQPAAATLEQHYISDATLNPFAKGYAAQSIDPLRVNPLGCAGRVASGR